MSKNIWKPTAEEKKRIRDFVRSRSHTGRFKIEIGERESVIDTTRPNSINVLLVDDCPDWSNSDLFSPIPWNHFVKGVPLNKDGKAVCDFYVYAVSKDCNDLMFNIQVYYANGNLTDIVD